MKFVALLILAILSSYVSSPAHVPNFDNFTTPVLEPGEMGKFNFTLENRYAAPMYNVTLNAEIYMWATENEAKDIRDIHDAPVIQESGNLRYTLHMGKIESGEIRDVVFHIKTFKDTPDGVYFVRFSLFFHYNGSEYKMWSRGYFSNEVWDNATRNHRLNLTYLSGALGEPVDGIVPDSSFSVKSSMMWVLYILIGLTTVVGIMALYSYLKEEGSVTKGDEAIYRLKGKYKQLEEEVREKMRKLKNQ